MRFSNTIIALAAALLVVADIETGALGNATIVKNNPIGVVYKAVLPEKQFFNAKDERGNVKGEISAVAHAGGMGVTYKVTFSNLPTSGGPFPYHLHVAAVPEDGNCTKTLAHLDPFNRGEVTACNAEFPETCQVGDLSGKYGKITSDPYTATYTDDFSSTLNGLGSFFGNRSFVVHFANKTRITCANFAKASTPTSNSTSPTGTLTPVPTGSSIQFTGIAVSLVPALPMLAVAGLALLL